MAYVVVQNFANEEERPKLINLRKDTFSTSPLKILVLIITLVLAKAIQPWPSRLLERIPISAY